MDRPRLPRRPELKPSDWSPRPIPQPAPERRTADPVTPTLKELAERERQRASLVVGAGADSAREGGPKPRPTTPAGLCTVTGLATPERAAAYKRDMQQLLQKNWGELGTTPKRVEHIQEIINAQLREAGVPDVTVNAAPELGTTGYFRSRPWRLDIGDQLLGAGGATLTPKQQADLTKTVYHEARHAEQYFLMARRRAALGEKPDAFARALGMNDAAADAAASTSPPRRADGLSTSAGDAAPGGPAREPLNQPGGPYWTGARGGCADTWYRSYAGEDSAARQQLLQVEMPAKLAHSNVAYRAYEAATKTHGTGSPEQREAWETFQAASKAAEFCYDRYRKLPEEADAWAIEDLVQ